MICQRIIAKAKLGKSWFKDKIVTAELIVKTAPWHALIGYDNDSNIAYIFISSIDILYIEG